MRIEDKLAAAFRAYASFRLLGQIASWIGTVYVVRHLTSHDMGEYGVAFVVFSFLSMSYDGTLLEALIQRPPVTDKERRATFTLVVGIGLMLGAATVACSGVIARWIGDLAIAPLVVGASSVLVLTAFSVLPNAILANQMAFPRLATIGAIQSLCVLVVTVSLAARGAGAWSLLAGLIAGAAVRALLLNIACWGLAWPTMRLSPAYGYVRFGGMLLLDNLLWRGYTSLDTFLLGRWSGTTTLGWYSLAQQVAELPLEKIARVVNDVSLPAYAALREDRRAAATLLLETIRMNALIAFPVFWGIAAVSQWFVPLVFGGRWQAAIFPLIALAAVAPLKLIGSIETPAMTGLQQPEVLIKCKLLIAPGMSIALLLGCWFGGINGAALVWAGVFPVLFGLAFKRVLAAVAVRYSDFLRIIRGPAAAAAVMITVVIGSEAALARLRSPAILVLTVGITTGVLVYCISLWLIDRDSFQLAQGRAERLIRPRLAGEL